MFDAEKFLIDFNIDFKVTGANTSKDFMNINCPFCYDSNFHLGLHREKGYGYCWKCGHHTIDSLIKELLPNEKILQIKKLYSNNFTLKKEKVKYNNTDIIVPGERMKIAHRKYLRGRGFDDKYLEKKYDLRGTNHIGDYNFRIIAPIYYNNKIVTYQGRDITGESEMKYKACKPENEILPIKNLLYNIDNCKSNFIVVTEGVVDVWRLGDNSCCLFGKNYTQEQLYLLKDFKKVFLFLDPDEAGMTASKKLSIELDSLGVNVYNIDNDCDPGDMKQKEADYLMNNL